MILDDHLRRSLAEHLRLLRQGVVLRVDKDSSLLPLVQDIASTSDLLEVDPTYRSDRGESFAVSPAGSPPRVVFAGPPAGHEFTSLVLALLHAGGHPPKVDPDLLDQVVSAASTHGEPLRFETFYSPSCQSCPDVVQALNVLALRCDLISHTALNATTNAAESSARNVLSVPTVFLNGVEFATGRLTFPELAKLLLARLSGPQSNSLPSDHGSFDLAVVGGGPAGIAAAIYAARKGLTVALVAERLGGQVLDTLGIENIIGIEHTEGPRYARDLETHLRAHPVRVLEAERVTALNPNSDSGSLHQLLLATGSTLSARSVVLATGASWRKLGVPGEQDYLRKGVTFCPHCDGPMFAKQRVAVIGGGNSGVEAALDLSNIASEVVLVEFAPALKADAVLQSALARRENVSVLRNTETLEVHGDGSKVTRLRLRDKATGTTSELDVSGVFIQIGLVPATSWLGSEIALTPSGEIITDERGRTSLSGVFAAGDVSTVPYKQIATAVASGAAAAITAFEYLMTNPEPLEVPVPAFVGV